jgi:hypothetical protein
MSEHEDLETLHVRLKALQVRLNKAERRQTALTWGIAALMLAVIVTWASRRGVPTLGSTIRAQVVEVVDERGVPRIRLGMNKSRVLDETVSRPEFIIFNAAEKPIVTLGEAPISSEPGGGRIVLRSGEDNGLLVVLEAAPSEGTLRMSNPEAAASFSVDLAGASLALSGQKEERRHSLNLGLWGINLRARRRGPMLSLIDEDELRLIFLAPTP